MAITGRLQGNHSEMDARGFVYFDWNASLDDALKKSRPQELIDNAMKTILEGNR